MRLLRVASALLALAAFAFAAVQLARLNYALGILFVAGGLISAFLAVTDKALRIDPERPPNPPMLGVILGGGAALLAVLVLLFN